MTVDRKIVTGLVGDSWARVDLPENAVMVHVSIDGLKADSAETVAAIRAGHYPDLFKKAGLAPKINIYSDTVVSVSARLGYADFYMRTDSRLDAFIQWLDTYFVDWRSQRGAYSFHAVTFEPITQETVERSAAMAQMWDTFDSHLSRQEY